MSQEISKELKDEIRDELILTEEGVRELLEGYTAVADLAWELMGELKEQKEGGYFEPTSNKTRELLMNLGGALRVRSDLERMLHQILRSRSPEDEEHRRDRQNREEEGVIKLTSSQKRALENSKNRQHRNRDSKRHDDVPGESPNHKS